ncbi:taurine transporter subunit [Chromobacterium violaceum]|uniref:Taurine transporter subunit n=1 Tax=Chromobacterium violaceum TaxID=536 RepID=A0A3S4HSP0_CHRVL|nr:taurine transporter subunit [Chromobacterium violaceum]
MLGKLFVVAAQGFMDATLWQHLEASLQRIALALVAAVAVGVPLGALMGAARWHRVCLIRCWRHIVRCRRSPTCR